ncbi:UDP-N-acetylmuramoyl-tripeptide--D-alanyl-D-alanine ligase [Marinicrinis lubricantis]|uniref:UDP-N-acetylmuramoyl-tripeptide--D-alanyl-D-alanine ligase n=1 Tax=Marinicrinis lubricantis TaxID=2086470 RepID=A0ABW1IS88_9BACL
MINRTLQQISNMAGGQLIFGTPESAIRGVSTDSRSIARDSLFIPLIGEKFNGHQYAEEAIQKGAAAVLWQADQGQPPEGVPAIQVENTLTALQQLASAYRNELAVRVIGITGSNGKTTTKDMVASILGTTYKVHKTEGNFNNHIGLPLTLLSMEEDTEMAVLEMGMSGRHEIELLSQLSRPEAVIITNIGEAHLMQLGSRLEIAKAKMEILSGIQEDGFFVYPGDEPLIEQLFPEMKLSDEVLGFQISPSIKYLRFGDSDRNDLFPISTMMDDKGTFFVLNTSQSPTYYVPMLGLHNVTNAIAAIAVSKYMGVSEADIVQGLKTMKATGMRIEQIEAKNGMTILNDCYNASPTSMKAALQLLSELPGYDTKIAVLGDMLELGEQEEQFHRDIGRLLHPDEIQYVFTYGELAEQIALAVSDAYPSGSVISFSNKEDIVLKLKSFSSGKTVVLVKGSRGMRLEEVVNGLR